MTDAPPRRRAPRGLPLLTGIAAFVLAIAAGGLMVADWTVRNMEMDALTTAVELSEAAMTRTQADLRATASSLTGGAAPTDQEKAGLLEEMTSAAARGEQRIGSAGDVVSQVGILPWHRDIIDARFAYLAHNLAWQGYMAEIAGDPKVYGTDQPLIDETFMAADPIMRAAVPVPDLFDLADRVNRIFVEGAGPPPADGGPEV